MHEHNEDHQVAQDRFRPQRYRRLEWALVIVGPLIALLAMAARGIWWVLSMPVRLHRDRRPRSTARIGDHPTYFGEWLANLPLDVRDDVRTIMAAIAKDLDRRWQAGAVFRSRSYVLTDADGVAAVRSQFGRKRPVLPDYVHDWRRDTVTEWFHHDAVEVPGHIATAFVRGSLEYPNPLGMDDRVIVMIRHKATEHVMRADLYCRTRGFVLRRSRLSADYTPYLTPQTAQPAADPASPPEHP